MLKYLQYASYLETLIEQSNWGDRADHEIDFHYELNGGAAKALKKLVPSTAIQESGAYFTGEKLARDAISRAVEYRKTLTAFDPSCGAGDLLLRWAETLPVEKSLEKTISRWGALLGGCDIHQTFVDVTKRRLVLSAISRGARRTGKTFNIDSKFTKIKKGDFLSSPNKIFAETVLLNPPFRQVVYDPAPTWTSGQVSQAAVFLVKCLEQEEQEKRIVAILPDVLRSGARYEKWRKLVAKKISIANVAHQGNFGNGVDIDVFVLNGLLKPDSSSSISWTSNEPGKITLGDFCSVRIGSVVPHRDPLKGPWATYFTAKDLPAWGEVRGGGKRRVTTSLLMPPLVAVRRTSSPSDRQRPIATIVDGTAPLALENHLIGIIPNNGRLSTCREILNSLQSPATREFLDKEIRCRHLTVGALKKLPFFIK